MRYPTDQKLLWEGIEKLSFNAFGEGTRLKHCITLHKRLFGVDVRKIGGDTGYAGTENRDHCKANDIQTSFTKRGRPSAEKQERDFVRAELARVRATTMEGSFWTQKEHYDLKRVEGQEESDGDPVHLLRHPHGERGESGRKAVGDRIGWR